MKDARGKFYGFPIKNPIAYPMGCSMAHTTGRHCKHGTRWDDTARDGNPWHMLWHAVISHGMLWYVPWHAIGRYRTSYRI